jgi:hypothetical protein
MYTWHWTLGNCVCLFGTSFYTFLSTITINICGLCLWRLHGFFLYLKCNCGHRRYYLIDNQANLIVICPLNVINKHRWSTEYCQRKREIIFTNRSLFVLDNFTDKIGVCFQEMKTNKFLSFIFIYFFSFMKVRTVFQVCMVGISNY